MGLLKAKNSSNRTHFGNLCSIPETHSCLLCRVWIITCSVQFSKHSYSPLCLFIVITHLFVYLFKLLCELLTVQQTMHTQNHGVSKCFSMRVTFIYTHAHIFMGHKNQVDKRTHEWHLNEWVSVTWNFFVVGLMRFQTKVTITKNQCRA